MGKHKHHKNKAKKVKKHKKCDKVRHSSSDSDSEIVWDEPESKTTEDDNQNKCSDQKEPNSPVLTKNDDLFDFIAKTSSGKQQSQHSIARNKYNEQQMQNEQKLRYTRELNNYFRDDVNKRFIDDPIELRKKHEIKPDKLEAEEVETIEAESEDETVSEAELNSMNAKIIKAEMLGNRELANELKTKLENLKKHMTNSTNGSKKIVRKVSAAKSSESKSEDSMNVKELYLQTRNITARDETMRFITSSSRLRSIDDEYDGLASKRLKKSKFDHLNLNQIRFTSSLNDQTRDPRCEWCLENEKNRHLIMKLMDERDCYLKLTAYRPLIPNVCMIISKQHNHQIKCSLDIDEHCWLEIRQIMRKLNGFYSRYYDSVPIFMEINFQNLKRNENLSNSHAVIECYPIRKSMEMDAKIYFHKAILDCEQEWSMNAKLIKLDGQPIWKKLPKGLSYFWMSIGSEFNGYGHVIEDEHYFDRNFGLDVIAGMYGLSSLNHHKRKQMENYDEQMRRIKDLKIKWSEYMNE